MKKSIIILLAIFLTSVTGIAQIRPYDKSGLNHFETKKENLVKYDKFKLIFGGSFTQSFQTLEHSNTSTANPGLVAIVPGFNTANANLYLDAYLADGVTLNMTLYLSSRHHNETWVKGGYIQFDKFPFLNSEFIDNIMKITTIKVGHKIGRAHV